MANTGKDSDPSVHHKRNSVTAGGNDPLSEKDIVGVVEELLEAQNDSYKLGLKFNLKPHVLDAIHKEAKDPFKCLLQVITEFFRISDPPPTWRVIVEALRSPLVNLPQLAKKVEAKHFPEPTTTPTEG